MSDARPSIPELDLLKGFADRQSGPFAPGFELFYPARREITWFGPDPDRARLDQLIPFATAGGPDSVYALWRCDDRAELGTLPVVFFGGDGDLSVDARGLRELFELLTVIEDGDAGLVPARREYLDWVRRTFGLTPPGDPAAIVRAAMLEYGPSFAEWVMEFSPEELVDDLLDQLDTMAGKR
ncbi:MULTISPECIES: hypothetical protein [Thermomonosporaceae]|uniref:hypothetical protein n=1 Tax=Thermomonosporaceae TaxID=2012 RepID=UPI00255A7898|nr:MULTISPECIES: hypothetical protein [Thermomonosporaceae]MDL4772432.1 hypothetical protein [Actinomadura xylanilytica]